MLLLAGYYWHDPAFASFGEYKNKTLSGAQPWSPSSGIVYMVDEVKYLVPESTVYLDTPRNGHIFQINQMENINMMTHSVVKIVVSNRQLEKWDLQMFPFDARKAQVQVCNIQPGSESTTAVPLYWDREPANIPPSLATAWGRLLESWPYSTDTNDKIPGSWSGKPFTLEVQTHIAHLQHS